MKLIIEIDEEVKEAFDKADDINFCFYDYNSVIGKAIQNGIPLDDIRTEIEDLDIHFDNDYFSENRDAMLKRDEVLQIIDNYKKGDNNVDSV